MRDHSSLSHSVLYWFHFFLFSGKNYFHVFFCNRNSVHCKLSLKHLCFFKKHKLLQQTNYYSHFSHFIWLCIIYVVCFKKIKHERLVVNHRTYFYPQAWKAEHKNNWIKTANCNTELKDQTIHFWYNWMPLPWKLMWKKIILTVWNIHWYKLHLTIFTSSKQYTVYIAQYSVSNRLVVFYYS